MSRVVWVSAGLVVCVASAVAAASADIALPAGEHLLAFLLAAGVVGCAVATLTPMLKE